MDTLFPYTTLFRSLEVYRKGHLVWLLDKSSWLYINAVPTSGNAPPAWPTTSNAYWQNMTPPSIASDRSPTQIGRASCRERVCQYGSISVVDVSLKKK